MLYSEFPETPREIDSSEIVIRYLTGKQDYVDENGTRRVAPKAFYPLLEEESPPTESKLVLGLSVTRQLTLPMDQIKELGNHVVDEKHRNAKEAGRTSQASLIGWAKLSATSIIELGLTMEKDEPPPHHANVISWPAKVPRKEKDQQELMRLVSELWQRSFDEQFL